MMRLPSIERLSALDLALTGLANRINHRRFCSLFFGAISRLGDGLFWYSLMVGLLLWDGRNALQPVTHMILAGIACTVVYKLLKKSLSRPRPFIREPRICLSTAPLDQFSFPSGHTLHAVCFTWLAACYYPALTGPLALFAALVALSRLILGLHYISDVFAGAAIGGGIAVVSLRYVPNAL